MTGTDIPPRLRPDGKRSAYCDSGLPAERDTVRLCLRCVNIGLVRSASRPEIAFFECPACNRRYALIPGKELTFRWGHPISLLLHPILFGTGGGPLELLRQWAALNQESIGNSRVPISKREGRGEIEEIELELEQPTQQVRDILDNPQSEEACREYLREYVELVRSLTRDA